MKKLFLFTLIILCVGAVVAQPSTTVDQIRRNNTSNYDGSIWTNSLTHYTEWIDMRDVDSAQVVVNFPDSVCAAFYVQNYTASDGVAEILLNAPAGTGAADSIVHVGDNTGYSHAFILSTWYDPGFPLIRIKTIFSATKNHATTGADYLGTKYKYYIKRFRHR